MRLKDAAGWNQTPQDWQNLLDLVPEGCFGLECDGVLAATTTVVCYGRALAWIGMVLTDPAYRGRGFARRLMDHALQYLDERRVGWIKLDATEMGRPIYERLGFRQECPVERWHRLPGGRPQTPAGVGAFELDATLDREAFGVDRCALLRLLARIESASSSGAGYAMGRGGSKAAYFGPCVSRSVEAARNLLSWFLARHPEECIYWDLLPQNAQALDLAQEFGFERVRELVRMARPGVEGAVPLVHDNQQVFAIAGFEYG